MKNKLLDFQQRYKIDYAKRINFVEVDFDDEKMELLLKQFFFTWLIENTDPDKVKVDSIERLVRIANQIHFDGGGYQMAKDKVRVYMGDFVHQELVNLNVFPPQCDREKFKHYKDYLSKVDLRFRTLKSLNEEMMVWNSNTGFLPYFEKAFETCYVNSKAVESGVNFFLKCADHHYLHELLQRKDACYVPIFMLPDSNMLKYHINPPLLLGNEELKKQYKKVLGTWLLAKLDERMLKYRLNNNNLPEAYILVKQIGEALFYNQKTTIEIERSLPVKPAATNFNPRIFKDAQAFELFEKLNTSEINVTDLSFLFRKMAEKENPPMILVRDKEFRDWYAEMYNPVLVQNFTKTFDRAYSKERYNTYESAKLHIF
ncbi:MAG: hypothetical protein ACYC01_13135 [Lutibacter sp.]